MTLSKAATGATAFFSLAAGVILLIVPWSSIWESNYFFDYLPYLRSLLVTEPSRAAVFILGLADLFIGFTELGKLLRSEP